MIILGSDDKKTSRYMFFMKTEPHESQVCEMYSIFEIHLQNNSSDDQVGICFPQFDHTHAMLASSWLSVHYSWLIFNFIPDSIQDLVSDLIPEGEDLIPNFIRDLINDLNPDFIPDLIPGLNPELIPEFDRFHG